MAGAAFSDQGIVRRIDVVGNTRTRTEVIVRELLFEPGDTLTSELVEETSRNLRALLFLGDARLDIVRDDGFADVTVRVTDLYARAITPLLAGDLDEFSYGAVGLDYNFLGRGQIIELTAEHDATTGNRVRAFFREPRVDGSRVRIDLEGEVAEEGHLASVSLSRPFYRLSERWSIGASAFSESFVTRLYSGQTLSEKYRVDATGGSVSLRHSTGEDVKVRPGVFLSVTDRSFDPEQGYVYAPLDRRRVLPSAGLTVWQPRYETTRFFSRLGRTEDVQTGSWATVRAGASLEALGSDRGYGFVTVDVNPRFKPASHVYVLSRLTYRSRFSDGRVWNVFGSAEGKVLVRIRDAHAFAIRLRYDALSRSEDASQYLLGSANGLRGYALRRFNGSKRLIFNVEARPTLVRKRDFTLAAAAFLDGGSAWSSEDAEKAPAISAGIGGRLGMNRVYNSPVMRADLGYGFRDRTWVLYLGLGQYF